MKGYLPSLPLHKHVTRVEQGVEQDPNVAQQTKLGHRILLKGEGSQTLEKENGGKSRDNWHDEVRAKVWVRLRESQGVVMVESH